METWLKRHQLKLIWLILFLALLFRLPLLNGSFWLDEAAQALESVRPFSQQLDIVQDFQPPMLHYITYFASSFSHAEWWLRLWGALIPGLVMIWTTYKIGVILLEKNQVKKSKSKKLQLSPLFASLLMATSSFHIFYSQELRPYALSAMWATLGTLLALKLIKIKQLKGKNYFKNWLFFTLVSILGLYSSYLYIFIFITQLLYLVWRKRSKIAFTTGLTTGVFFAPWLPMFLKQLAAGQTLRLQLPGWENVVSLSQLKALFLVEAKFIFGVMDIEPNLFFIISVIVIFVSALKSLSIFFKKSSKFQDKAVGDLLFFYLVPFILAWLVSFFIPVIRPKRLLYLMPYFFLLVSLPLDFPFKKLKNNWLAKLSLPLVVLIIQLIGAHRYYAQPALQRENWRELKQEIITKFPANETVAVFSFDKPFAPWLWYEPRAIDSFATGKLYIQDVSNLVTALKPVADYKYILIFDYLRTLTDPDDILIREIKAFGYEGRGTIDYPGIGFVRIYVRPNEIIGAL